MRSTREKRYAHAYAIKAGAEKRAALIAGENSDDDNGGNCFMRRPAAINR